MLTDLYTCRGIRFSCPIYSWGILQGHLPPRFSEPTLQPFLPLEHFYDLPPFSGSQVSGLLAWRSLHHLSKWIWKQKKGLNINRGWQAVRHRQYGYTSLLSIETKTNIYVMLAYWWFESGSLNRAVDYCEKKKVSTISKRICLDQKNWRSYVLVLGAF